MTEEREAYDRLLDFTKRCERLLREIRDGKHSLPGTLVQIDRLLAEGHPEFRVGDPQVIPGNPFRAT